MKSKFLLFIVAGIIFVAILSIFLNSRADIEEESGLLYIKNKKVNLIIADTKLSRVHGLSSMEFLPKDSAMLFVFEDLDKYGFWMKDMKFPIDIIWADQDKKIVHIEKNISPSTYPRIFFPPQKSLYVLEANAFFTDENGFKVGNILNFYKK